MRQQLNIKRVFVAAAVVLVLGGFVAWYAGVLPIHTAKSPQNAIMVIAPYRFNGTWVFDDSRFGLVREPFVAGVPAMIDALVESIPDAEHGFRLTFSSHPFPDSQKKLTWLRGDLRGNYYKLDDPPMEGWICPAMFKYYDKPPAELYVRADPLPQK